MHSSDLDKPSSLLRQEAVICTVRHKLNEIYWWQDERWRARETEIKTLPRHLTYSLSNSLWLWLVAPLFECITQPRKTKAQASINKACVFQAVPVCADLGLSAHSAWLTEVATFCWNKLESLPAIHFLRVSEREIHNWYVFVCRISKRPGNWIFTKNSMFILQQKKLDKAKKSSRNEMSK